MLLFDTVSGRGDRLWKVQFSELQRPRDLTLTRFIRHTVMHHSSTSTYTPNFTEIEQTFCGRMYGHTDRRTFLPLMLLRRLGGVDLKMQHEFQLPCCCRAVLNDQKFSARQWQPSGSWQKTRLQIHLYETAIQHSQWHIASVATYYHY